MERRNSSERTDKKSEHALSILRELYGNDSDSDASGLDPSDSDSREQEQAPSLKRGAERPDDDDAGVAVKKPCLIDPRRAETGQHVLSILRELDRSDTHSDASDLVSSDSDSDEPEQPPSLEREVAHPDDDAGAALEKPRLGALNRVVERYRARAEETRQLSEEALGVDVDESSAEETDDPERVCWNNLRHDNERCRAVCGFSANEFLELYGLVAKHLPEHEGRGRRSKVSPEDKLLMALCYVKHYETADQMKDSFACSKTQLHVMLHTTIGQIMPVLYAHFVTNLHQRVDDDEEDVPEAFPDATFALDAAFQAIWTPGGLKSARQPYYCERRKLYGVKSLCLHDRQGRVAYCVPGERGATPDLSICVAAIEPLRALVRDEYVLADAGFRGLHRMQVNAIVPDMAASRHNQMLEAELAVCQQFQGRMKSLFRIMAVKYRNSRNDYVTMFRLCVALTNYDVLLRPLDDQ